MDATFALFRNNYKQQDNHPDYKGNGKTPDGSELDIAAWIRKDKNGNSYFSVKVSPKREFAPKPDAQAASAPAASAPSIDDMPF